MSGGRHRLAMVGVAGTMVLALAPVMGAGAQAPPHRPAVGSAPAAPAGVVTRIPTPRRVVALTFDGGGDAAGARSILRTLRAEHVRATFFLTGRFALAHRWLSRQLATAGRLGDHTMNHPHLPKLGDRQVRAEVWHGRRVVKEVTGVDPKPLFRFPYGDYDARTLRVVTHAGWTAIGWTVDSRGWQGLAHGNDAVAVANRVLAARQPGEIVLMHLGANPDDHSTLDAAALPRVISRLRAHHYRFVALRPELLATRR